MAITETGPYILALKRAITATFTIEKWKELGYITNTIDRIKNHPRLLRSLGWGDDDYAGHVFWAIEMMVNADPDNLQKIIDFVHLEDWLRNNDPEMYARLYGGGIIALDQVEESARILDIEELSRQANRIRNSIESDPELAIGSVKELLETVFKNILNLHGPFIGDNNFMGLWKKVREHLKIDDDESSAGQNSWKRMTSSLNQIVQSVNEIRNLYGTGHGKVKSQKLEIPEVRLTVNSGIAIAVYVLEKKKVLENKRI